MIPQPLQPGALLAALSPAGPIGQDESERGIAALRKQGYEVELLPSALEQDGYLAGPDLARSTDVMAALTDPRFDGAVCTRGGYGTLRLLEQLDYEAIRKAPARPFVGFSDITALQQALWQRCGLVSFSGPQLARGFGSVQGLDPFSAEGWFAALEGRQWDVPLPLPPGHDGLRVHHAGRAEGRLLGGNLAVLAGLAGTPFQPSFDDAVVVLEEIDEPPYRLDRMLSQLALAGCFDGAKAILLGEFIQHLQGQPHDHSEMVAARLSELLPGIPLFSGAPYGHVGPCWTLPLGATAQLDADNAHLTLPQPR